MVLIRTITVHYHDIISLDYNCPVYYILAECIDLHHKSVGNINTFAKFLFLPISLVS